MDFGRGDVTPGCLGVTRETSERWRHVEASFSSSLSSSWLGLALASVALFLLPKRRHLGKHEEKHPPADDEGNCRGLLPFACPSPAFFLVKSSFSSCRFFPAWVAFRRCPAASHPNGEDLGNLIIFTRNTLGMNSEKRFCCG
ncbi:hypothetical protein CSUI_008319 [Cystoisospora suis]|uniref:Uncharacterized protein n=1 Tax=Cystoisospora suis TaxID=483139 RepID=A0A2C6KMX9_9APIC|nr:hypothetical protein CSUI_008319 [Cystoisospora suis]